MTLIIASLFVDWRMIHACESIDSTDSFPIDLCCDSVWFIRDSSDSVRFINKLRLAGVVVIQVIQPNQANQAMQNFDNRLKLN